MRWLTGTIVCTVLASAVLAGWGCGSKSVPDGLPARAQKPEGPPPPEARPRPAVSSQVEGVAKEAVKIEDGEAVEGAPAGKSAALHCARGGCQGKPLPEKSLVHAGKTLHFCSDACLAEYKKANRIP